MPEESASIIIDDDSDYELSYVRFAGITWKFVYEHGSLGWWRRYMAWSRNRQTVIDNEGPEADTDAIYDLAAEVLCPANGDRKALEKRGPHAVLGAMQLFASAWSSGPQILKQIANQMAAQGQAQQRQPDIQPEAKPRRARRSA